MLNIFLYISNPELQGSVPQIKPMVVLLEVQAVE